MIFIGNNGICAITTINNDENLEYRYNGGEFLKIKEYLSNINLGLIERAPADFGRIDDADFGYGTRKRF